MYNLNLEVSVDVKCGQLLKQINLIVISNKERYILDILKKILLMLYDALLI